MKNKTKYALIRYIDTSRYEFIEFEEDNHPGLLVEPLHEFMGRYIYEVKKIFNSKRELNAFVEKVNKLAEKEKESKNGRQ